MTLRSSFIMSDSASPASQKSTTPTTDNRADLKKPRSESAMQPELDTAGRTLKGGGVHDKSMERQAFPQLSDPGVRKETLGHSRTSSLHRSSRASSGTRRRSHSEEYPAHEEQAYYDTGGYGYPSPHVGYHQAAGLPIPPQMMMPSRPHSYNPNQSAPPNMQGRRPPSSRRRQSHQRVHSLPQASSASSQFFDGLMPRPPHNFSPSGNRPDSPFSAETGPLLPYGDSANTGSYRKRKSQTARAPAPFMMPTPPGAAAPGMYGSMDNRSYEEMTPPPPPQSAPPHNRPENFSPRGEFRKLTSGFGPRGTPPSSPSMGGPYTRTPRMSPTTNGPSLRSPGFIRGDDARVSFSPRTPLQEEYNARSSGPYLMSSEELNETGNTPEAASYRDMRRGKPPSRRKHMRQKSAQLFMEDTKGVKQPLACRDVLFYLLFVLHLVGVGYLGAHFSRDAFKVNDKNEKVTVNVYYRNVIFLCALCGVFAATLSTLTLILMTLIVRRLVQVSLILTIALSFAWGTIGIGVSPKNVVPITGFVALALSVGYTFVVWDRIPFASANLQAGLTGVRRNAGSVLVALFFQFLVLVWSVYFTFVVIGVYDAMLEEDLKLSHNATIFVYTMLFISYFWTYNVLSHVVQVTVAGTIGSWWFKPDSGSSFCDTSITSSLFQAITTSFGSICFGSLLVEPVRLIRQLSVFFRPSRDEEYSLMCVHECLACVQQCITTCVENLSDYFNPWAFTYIGLYRYGLLESGHKATELFEKRGWISIVSDDLVHNILLMACLVVGGVTGCFGVLIQYYNMLSFSTLGQPSVVAFVIGLCTGLVVTGVLFGIITSSVNAVIVLFAGSPIEFEKNHPELSNELRSAWREVWPGCMDIVDIRVENMNLNMSQPGAAAHPIV